MNTRPQEANSDIFLDELEYLTGPIQGIYKTTKNARKYIITGLNRIDEQLKPVTYASFNNNLNEDNAIQYIDHWMQMLQTMKQEIQQFQKLCDFEQTALKQRIDFINQKYNQLQRENHTTNQIEPYRDHYPFYHFPYSSSDKKLISNKPETKAEDEKYDKESKTDHDHLHGDDDDDDDDLNDHKHNNNNQQHSESAVGSERVYGTTQSDRHYRAIWMDRLLIDYLCRNQYNKTAYALVEDTDLKTLSNIRLYHKIREPLDAIKNRNPSVIIKWCRLNKTLLKQHKSNLEFMARARVVIEILRTGDIIQAADYITNQMNKDLELEQETDAHRRRRDDEKDTDDDGVMKWRWQEISELFTCSHFVPVMFRDNDKYAALLQLKYQCEYSGAEKKKLYEKCKREYKNDVKKKVPKNVYKLFFKPKYYWKKIETEFWRIFKLIYGLNKYSMLEYVLSSSLQTVLTPYCYHKEWAHPNCITCIHGRNKMGKLCRKSHIRGIELAATMIVSDKESAVNSKDVKNNEYHIIENCMINNEETIAISKNEQTFFTSNGCVINKHVGDTLSATGKASKNTYDKLYLFYDLV